MIRTVFNFFRPSAPGGLRAGHYVAGLAASALLNVGLISPHLSSPAKQQWLPNNGPLPPVPARVLKAPPAPLVPATAASWHVGGVTVCDENAYGQRYNCVNVSKFINRTSAAYDISPVFVTAVIFTESGGVVNSERWAGGLDNSCGLMQQIVTNVLALHPPGVYDDRTACNWEENPYNSIIFGIQILADDIAQHGGRVPPPQAYVMYNAGSGYPDWWYFNPTGQAYDNYYGNFIPNWNYAWAHYATLGPILDQGPTPAPRPVFHFPTKRWCRYDWHNHHHCPSPYWKRDHLGKVPFTWSHWRRAFHRRGTVDHVCGGVRGREHWNGKLRFEKQWFAHCIAFSWPRYHGDPVKWVRLHHPKAPAPAPTPGQPTPSPTPPTAQPSPTPAPISGSPASFWLALLNNTRAQYGVAPLTLDATQSSGTGSCVGSQGHSDAMAASGKIWHVDSDYPAASFPANLCVFYHTAGENVGVAGGDEDSAIQMIHNLMMAEPHDVHTCATSVTHACNIINGSFRSVGFGFTQANGQWFLTTDFLG